MSAKILDGKAIADELRAKVAQEAAKIAAKLGRKPGLAAVLVGEDPASQTYVKSKAKATNEAGMISFEHRLPENTSEKDLLALVAKLNADDAVDGILVQLPLPKQIDTARVIEAVDPAKDVDGFHPMNAGKLATGLPSLVPGTPMGCIVMAKKAHASLAGLDAVVVGRSNIVGKPLAQLLIAESATVTVAHSKTKNLQEVCRRADLLCVAIGKPEFVKGDWIKPGATVIDVGINRVAGADGKNKLVGDVAFEEASSVAGWITPVPGGVGRMTVACLLVNTLRAAAARAGLEAPSV
ncbi:MAG: bifunctional methylenetetrahydrofolate dehydrogenase/methenyltetrahydrofolate cyclohydrolase FolD [Xanthobacteraceae bacterium]|nr:bifunctional methylenetetrahydrofolate dehydrogenase/methenyltetrahydrofolate cyclohydrolase FolD [Xanthobacteraceae bacterium]MCW5677724.1 bifunctional methylenetetrahydrofolate dehydrogenase/methenyltetrahydrofolate cyclohydrolase FolD [Xanthobacteraceae bacterium]